MKYKIKKRENGKLIKKEFIKRTKKAFKLSPSETKRINKIKKRIKKKIPTKKKIKKYASRINFGNMLFE